jgi:hypothetical protein
VSDAPDEASPAEAPLAAPADQLKTGDASVDAVLASLTGLDDLPVAEHVAVFEAAHEKLQAALAADPGPVAGPGPVADPVAGDGPSAS